MPSSPRQLVSSPPLLFCPPPRRTYDYLQSDDEIDCAEPRRPRAPQGMSTRPRSLESSRSHAKNKVVTPKEGKAESAAAVKLKRRSTQRTQKHSKQVRRQRLLLLNHVKPRVSYQNFKESL